MNNELNTMSTAEIAKLFVDEPKHEMIPAVDGDQVSVYHFYGNRIQTIMKNDEPWFVAKEIAEILGYRDAANLSRRLDDDERGTRKMSTLSGEQEMTIINESGLYSAILGSSKPEAKVFKKWVTGEVLPSIRKNGSYEYRQEIESLKSQLAEKSSGGSPRALYYNGVPVITLRALSAAIHVSVSDIHCAKNEYPSGTLVIGKDFFILRGAALRQLKEASLQSPYTNGMVLAPRSIGVYMESGAEKIALHFDKAAEFEILRREYFRSSFPAPEPKREITMDHRERKNYKCIPVDFMDIHELSETLGIPLGPIYRMIKKRLVPYYKSGKMLLFKRTEIEEWNHGTILGHEIVKMN